ncbi:phosphotransferase enzyme family [Lecanosticta acicola]|uniref:Phosphotransferase enzyme family n=1 Tax=Lecanosticta acicola TaxID=111012 RepID=A0AAI8YRU5_9PEZI|nr:phosphotransferase enzyme family [Lecanosticta acicola]
MNGVVSRLLQGRKKHSKEPYAREHDVRPGDGIGYPVPYEDQRIEFSHELLKRCKTLTPYSGAYRMNETTVVKTGDAVRMAEAEAMRLVAEKTSIPVPRVFDAYIQESDGHGVIIMEYIQGETLDKAWPSYSTTQKDALLGQLRGFLMELRSIGGSKISAVDGSHCSDQFFDTDNPNCGPFDDERDFHQGLADALRKRGDTTWCQMVSRFLISLGGHDIVLTHNDLAPRNILVQGGSVVAILDWEMSGYYPDYWEYVKAHLWAEWTSEWIAEGIPDQILTPRLPELAYLLHARDIVWS